MLDHLQLSLIELIDRQEVASSAYLASSLNISKRSVINYVRKVNEEYPSLIRSSGKGYSLDPEVLQRMRASEESDAVVNPSQRILFLIWKLLSSYQDKLRISDIGEELHYSESTVRSDLYKFKDMCAELDLDIQIANNSVAIVGPELKKRQLYFRLFQSSIEKNIYDFSQLKLFFPQYDSGKLYSLLTDCFQNYNYEMSDYSAVNILYHIMIGMDRIAHGHFVDGELYLKFLRNRDISAASELAETISQRENIHFPESEIQNLAMLLSAANVTPDGGSDVGLEADDGITVDNLREYLWPSCYDLVMELAQDIRDIYHVDIQEDEPNFIRFALYVRALIRRLHTDTKISHPYTNVKATNPVAFDCAAFVADRIRVQFEHTAGENEMAYMALCLGHVFARRAEEIVTLNTLFVLPAYHGLQQVLFDFYSERMRQSMTSYLVTSLEAYEDLSSIDLVISTLRLPAITGKRSVQISPIQNVQDQRKIFRLTEKIRNEKALDMLRSTLATLVDDTRFYKNPPILHSRDAILQYMVQPLIQEKIVSEDFPDALLHREHLSGTAIGRLAVPHTWTGDAARDTLSILISDSPIVWGNKVVHGVFLFTSSAEHYATTCLHVMGCLPQLLENSGFMKSLMQCGSCEDFLNLFK